jgi:tetratricopeptide (TPR) repeat protein
MPKLTNLLIPIIISTGVISCTSQSFVRKSDVHQQVLLQQEVENMAGQTGYAGISTENKAPTINTKSKYAVNKATGKEDDAKIQKTIDCTRKSKPVTFDYANTVENDPTYEEFTTVNLIEKTETPTELEESVEKSGKRHIYNLPAGQKDIKDLSPVGLAHLNLGIAYAERDLIDQAILEFQSAIEANPHHLEAHVRLGTTYGLKGMTNEALSEFKKAIDINLNEAVAKIVFSALPVAANQKVKTDVVKAHINLGNAYKEEGKLKRSQLEYEKALEHEPEHPIARRSLSEIYYSLGTSCLENKKYDNAIDAFNKVLGLNPGFPQIKDVLEKAHYNLGINYAKNGELNKAIIEFNKTMEINLNYAMLDKNNLNIISKDKKAVSGKHIHHDRNRPDENVNNSTNGDKRKDSSHVEEKEGGSLRKQMPHKIDVVEEMILAEKGNAKESEYVQNQVESQRPLLLSQEDNKSKLVQSNKASFETGQLKKADDSEHEKVQLKTEISNEDQGKKQIKENIAHVKTVDTEETDVSDLGFPDQERNASLQVRGEEEAENSNTYNLDEKKEMSKESLAQFNQPDEDKIVAIQADSPVAEADDNILASTYIVPGEIKSTSGHRVFSYYVTRNYNSKIGFNEAIKKYEDVIRKNPYGNNAHHNLAYAYYSKALHLDDAIARREGSLENNQSFTVKRFYIHDIVDDKEIDKINLIKHTETFDKESVALYNRSGYTYFKKGMFNDAILEYRNALEIDPKYSKTLYNLAFSFLIKGSHLDIALRDNKKY